MTTIETVLPFRLGFFLDKSPVTLPFRPEQLYRGVERMYFVEAPLVRNAADTLTVAREQVWNEYFEARETGQLHFDLRVARRVRDAFAQEGLELEIIYVEISHI
jgi:hypothetical protein